MNNFWSTREKIFVAAIIVLAVGFFVSIQNNVNKNLSSDKLLTGAEIPSLESVPGGDKDAAVKQAVARKDQFLGMARYFSGTVESVSGSSFKVKDENYLDYSGVDFSDTKTAIAPVVTTKVLTVELTPKTMFGAGRVGDIKSGAQVYVGVDESIYSAKVLRAMYINIVSPISTTTPIIN